MERYDGTIVLLANKSRHPHTSPNAHTEAEIKLIKIIRGRIKKPD